MNSTQSLLKAVVAARVADSVQYWESACEYFSFASLDLAGLRSLFQLYERSNAEWLAELNRLKRADHTPSVVTEYLGVKISGDSALTLAIRSLVHHLRTTFEALAQFVNAVALADSRLPPEGVNVRSVKKELKRRGGFGDLTMVVERIVDTADYYQYLADLDNTLKHLVAIEPHIQWFILENRLEADLPSFTKEDRRYGHRTYPRKPLLSTSQELITFAEGILREVERIVSTGCGVVWQPLVQNRHQDLFAYHQYDELNGKNVLVGQVQFVQLSALPVQGDVLRLMSVVETDVEDDVHYELVNCSSSKIVLRDANRIPTGIAEAVQPLSAFDEVQLITYREYRVIEVGPVSQFTIHKLLNETEFTVGRPASIVTGLSANSFWSGLMTGEPPVMLSIDKDRR